MVNILAPYFIYHLCLYTLFPFVSAANGPLTRQLYRLDPHAEILNVTPMHILGFNVNTLSSEQLDCCENVLTTLLTNVRTVRETKSHTTINEMSQQLADAQAMIQNLTLQLEASRNGEQSQI